MSDTCPSFEEFTKYSLKSVSKTKITLVSLCSFWLNARLSAHFNCDQRYA
jgi:hypothetical protein